MLKFNPLLYYILFCTVSTYSGVLILTLYYASIFFCNVGVQLNININPLCIVYLGVLLRKLESGLIGISHVIVDEVHERDINVSPTPSCELWTLTFDMFPDTHAHVIAQCTCMYLYSGCWLPWWWSRWLVGEMKDGGWANICISLPVSVSLWVTFCHPLPTSHWESSTVIEIVSINTIRSTRLKSDIIFLKFHTLNEILRVECCKSIFDEPPPQVTPNMVEGWEEPGNERLKCKYPTTWADQATAQLKLHSDASGLETLKVPQDTRLKYSLSFSFRLTSSWSSFETWSVPTPRSGLCWCRQQ